VVDNIITKLDYDYTLKVLKKMIRIPSVVGEEGQIALYLHDELRALGLTCELHEVEPGRFNIYAKLMGSGHGRRLSFIGHTDTIPVVEGWDTDLFTAVERGNRLYGLGACDMKAGLACILNMLRAFVMSEYRFKGELYFSGVIDEEGYSKGARALMETDYGNVDAVVLAEPYPGDEIIPIPLGITGKILYDINVKGKAAHGFSPHLGVNAIEEAAKILASLDQLTFKNHPAFGIGNYSTLTIVGGYKEYSVVIPDRCRFEVNRLLVPGETVENVVADMQQLVSSLNLAADVEMNIKPPQYEAYVMNKDSLIIQIFESVYKGVMGKKPFYNYIRSISDANIFAGEKGIPCLHLGPQRGGVHQKNEYVRLDWLPRVSKMFVRIAERFLARK
jgi:succinyl-diaminopimelate desuccinylase